MSEDILNQFVSELPIKTPPMTVRVINHKGKVIGTYETPAGFQLERYVEYLYPYAEIMVTGTNKETTVSLALPGTKEIFEIHHGIHDNTIYH